MKRVRTRFAPSPTGFQHIGGFRTALYAWLYARKKKGDFILRIEDTDQERKVEGAVRYILESMEWLGLDIDEGPDHADLQSLGDYWEGAPALGGKKGSYVQTRRAKTGRYKEVAEKLIQMGVAYRCDLTAEELAKLREQQEARGEAPGYAGHSRDRNVSADTEHVVRLRIPDHFVIQMDDAVRGKVSWENPPLRDPVLLKSDGLPTYHLACIVDDHDMEITHVMRSEEWLPSAPIHLFLYDQLGWERPVFCHLSQILAPDGKKLSKRNGAHSLDVYRNEGFLPEALLNAIALIGWSPGEAAGDKELFSRDDLIEHFSLERLGKSGGIYDPQKLEWFNGMYMRALSVEKFTEAVMPFFQKAGVSLSADHWDPVAAHVQERCRVLSDAVSMTSFIFQDEFERDFEVFQKKKLDPQEVSTVLNAVASALESLDEFTPDQVQASMKSVVSECNCKPAQVFIPVRIAVTGSMNTPPLGESIVAVGKGRAVSRIRDTAQQLGSASCAAH